MASQQTTTSTEYHSATATMLGEERSENGTSGSDDSLIDLGSNHGSNATDSRSVSVESSRSRQQQQQQQFPRDAKKIDLGVLPPLYILPTHFEHHELHQFESKLTDHGGAVASDAKNAQLFVGNVERPRRAMLELRELGLKLESSHESERLHKKRRLNDFSKPTGNSNQSRLVEVVRRAWIDDSIEAGHVLPVQPYLVCSANCIVPDGERTSRVPAAPTRVEVGRTREEPVAQQVNRPGNHSQGQELSMRRNATTYKPPSLQPQTTSEHDFIESLPPPPAWVRLGFKYACQRRSPMNNPNRDFIDQLKEVRRIRELKSDAIGVRAYSTAIAAISALPVRIMSSAEVSRLPGCQGKIGALYDEFEQVGSLPEVREADEDEQMRILRAFYDIWGVGSITARDFYARGWKQLDDVVEFGWETLTRVQQIGVKYYDEFLLKMSRAEVERIHGVVHGALRHVVRSRGGDEEGARSCLVGGHRKGKTENGDVDVVVSHRNDDDTLDIVNALVTHLFELGYVTHNLGVTLSNSKRAQHPVPFIGLTGGGHGFDTLDKALVVWQDLPESPPQDWHTMTGDQKAAWRKQNPSEIPHRRVDIIVSPWRTVGCAVLGWSAGTTFERDLRRYAKYAKGWKFDSSGVRDRASGKVLDLERRRDGSRAATFDEAERLVFEGLGLEYIAPEERNTG